MPNSGLDAMIDHGKIDDLSRLYSLYGLINEGVPCLRRFVKSSIERRGAELNKASMEGREVDNGGAEDEPDPSPKGKGKVKARPPNAGAHGLALALRWVEDVLHMKDKFEGIWEMAFKSNREIESGLNEVIKIGFISCRGTDTFQAFESFINLHPRAPEFVSLYIDDNLKKGLKGVRCILRLFPAPSHSRVENRFRSRGHPR